MTDSEGLSVNFQELKILDTIPSQFQNVTKINISHNQLENLDGIQQFRNLTQISMTHNKITSFEELFKISHPENVRVICLAGNPLALHVNLEALLLHIFPNLIEIDGVKMTDHTRQDISDSLVLSKRLLSYFYKNELILNQKDIEVKKLKLKFELIQKRKLQAAFWEEINAIHSRELKKMKPIPRLPDYSYNKLIRPYMILNYIEVASKSMHSDMTNEINPHEITRVFKSLFCEILLQFHSWGHLKLQKYLQHKSKPTQNINDQFAEELKQFYLLSPITLENKNHYFSSFHTTDIFPNSNLDNLARKSVYQMNQNFLENLEKNSSDYLRYQNLSLFPIFGCYSEYIKALFGILQNQIDAIKALNSEKEELLRFDCSGLGLPSIYDGLYKDSLQPVQGIDRNKYHQTENLKHNGLRISNESNFADLESDNEDDISRFRRAKPLNRERKPTNMSQEFIIPEEDEPRNHNSLLSKHIRSLSQEKTQKFKLKEDTNYKLEPNIDEIMHEELDRFEKNDLKDYNLLEFYKRKLKQSKNEQILREVMNAWKNRKNRKLEIYRKKEIGNRHNFKTIRKKILKEWYKKSKQTLMVNLFYRHTLMIRSLRSIKTLFEMKKRIENEAAVLHKSKNLTKYFKAWKNAFKDKKTRCKSRTEKRKIVKNLDPNAKTTKNHSQKYITTNTKKQLTSDSKQKFKKDINKLLTRISDSGKSIGKLWRSFKNPHKSHVSGCLCSACDVCSKEKFENLAKKITVLKKDLKNCKKSNVSINL